MHMTAQRSLYSPPSPHHFRLLKSSVTNLAHALLLLLFPRTRTPSPTPTHDRNSVDEALSLHKKFAKIAGKGWEEGGEWEEVDKTMRAKKMRIRGAEDFGEWFHEG